MAKRKFALLVIAFLLFANCKKQEPPPSSNAEAPKPAPKPITGAAIIEAFKAANLPMDNIVYYNEENDPNKQLGRPGGYIEKIIWADKRVKQTKEKDTGGTIEIFANDEDLEKRKGYLEAGFPGFPLIEYRYILKKAIVRIRQDLTPKQAKDYEDALAVFKDSD